MTVRLPGKVRPSTVITLVAGAALATIAIALLTAGTPATATRSTTAQAFSAGQVGDPAKQVSLAHFGHRPLIINFFGSWCAPCRQETPLLARFYRAHGGRVIIIGIDVSDSTSSALKFLRASGVTYPVAADPNFAIAATYGAESAFPQTFFVNARHRIVRHVFGQVTLAELNAWAATIGVAVQNGTT